MCQYLGPDIIERNIGLALAHIFSKKLPINFD
jgi:hypothetical protein